MNPTQIKVRLLDAQDDICHITNLLELINMAASSLHQEQANAISEACGVAKASAQVTLSRLSELVAVLSAPLSDNMG